MVRFKIEQFAHCLVYLTKAGAYAHRIILVQLGTPSYLITNTGEEFSRRTGYIAGGTEATSWNLVNHDLIIEMLIGARPRPSIYSFGVHAEPYSLFNPMVVPTALDTASRLTRKSLETMLLAHKIEPSSMCQIPLDIPNRPRLKSTLRSRAG
jgi:hypothetical protein